MADKKSDVVLDGGMVYVLRSGTPVYVKTADICAMTGKSNQWIGQLVSQGILSKRSTPHGAMFDMAAAMHAYCDMLENRATSKQEISMEKDKQEAELSIKRAKAIIATLEATELQGKMHRSDDVASMTEDLIFTIRGMLIALPGRLAVDTAGAATPAETAKIIREEVFTVMSQLANYKYDPQKYEERVRERRSWNNENGCEPDDE